MAIAAACASCSTTFTFFVGGDVKQHLGIKMRVGTSEEPSSALVPFCKIPTELHSPHGVC
jgi:hypothetical protein